MLCYKSKTLSNGEHPLMIRVCKDGKKKYKSLGVSVNPKYWNFERNTLKPNCPNYEYLSKLIADKASELSAEIVKLKSERKEFTASTLIDEWKTQAWMPPAAKVDLTPENNLILPLKNLADGVNIILGYLPLKAFSLRTLSPVSVMRCAVWTIRSSMASATVVSPIASYQSSSGS